MIEVRPPRKRARRSRSLAAIGLAAAMAAGGALIGGCGSSAPTANPVSRAAYVSSRESGVRFTLNLRLAASGLSRGFAITGSGYAGKGDHSARMTMNFSGIPGATGLPSGGHGVDAVFVYPTVYMRIPFLTDKLPEGKTWLQIDLGKVLHATGSALPQALGIGQIDPTQFLQYLKASSGQVKDLGSEQLYGVSTTHYLAKLQLPSILKRLPSQEREAARPLLQHVGNAGSIPIGVWVDGKDRVRKLQIGIDISGTTATGSATVTVGFTEYGPVPSVTPPPATEVLNLTSLLSKGLASTFTG